MNAVMEEVDRGEDPRPMVRITPSDPSVEKLGVWTEYRDIPLKIRRLRQGEMVEFRREQQDLGVEDFSPWHQHMAPLAALVLLDWKWEDGPKPTPANRLSLMEDDEDARVFVLNFATAVERFTRDAATERLGNSSAASTGS